MMTAPSPIPTQEPEHDGDHRKSDAAKDIERVTDYAPEIEVDTDKLGKAMSTLINTGPTGADNSKASVVIKVEDVDFMCNNLEMPRVRAETALRQAGGDLKLAMRASINSLQYF